MSYSIRLTESEFRNIIKKYWEIGMNNVYWDNIKDKVIEDINKYQFRRDTIKRRSK
jgi:hypothetical protein